MRLGGLPYTKVRKTGTYAVVVPQSRIAPRKQRIKLEQKYMCQNGLLFGGGAVAGSCDNMFFCVNNISPAAFTNGGAGASSQNIWGLDADMGACSLANPPRGLNTLLFNNFEYGIVMASELRLKIQRTGNVSNVFDGEFLFALTPVTNAEALQLFTTVGTQPAIGYTTINNWIGATPAQQWTTCINQPGTVVGRIGPFNSGKDTCTIRLRHHQNYFNTEPLWPGYLAYQCTKTAPYYLPVTYASFYVFTFYQAQAYVAQAASIPFATTVTQRWYVHAFEPIPAPILS